MAEFVVTDKLKKWIGYSDPPVIYKVEEGAIQRYARAVGDSNPLYNDLEYASRSKYGRIIAPPGFVGWPVANDFEVEKLIYNLIADGAPPENVDGGIEYDFLCLIGAGDILTAVIKLIDIVGRETKLGPTMVTTYEITYINQRGAMALIARGTFLNF